MGKEKNVYRRIPDKKHRYLCCEVLHTYLNFEDDHLRPYCCHDDPDYQPRWAYKGEAFSLEKLQEYLSGIAEMIHKEPARCERCRYIYYDKVPQEGSLHRYKLKRINFNPHRLFCNLNCSYCFITPSKRESRFPPYSVLQAVEFLFNNNFIDDTCEFLWGGGESTILPEFETVTRLIADKGHKQVLNTNGTVFSEAWAYTLALSKETYFNISIDSGTRETYKRIKGKDMFDIVWTNIAKYQSVAKNKYSFKAKYILMETNREKNELENFIRKCVENGVMGIEIAVEGKEVFYGITRETFESASYLKTLALNSNFLCDWWSNHNKETIEALENFYQQHR